MFYDIKLISTFGSFYSFFYRFDDYRAVIFLYLICIFINFYYLGDLNLNIKDYINDYIDLHIVFNS